jgi:2-hydroxychromene-2-carboxylate isomerase
MSMPVPLFFFGAMSPYSWLAAERIEQVVPQARWRMVLAGVLFSAHGRTSWGLTDGRAAGMADCEARAAERGLGPIRWPAAWPSSDLTVARAGLVAEARGSLRPFALAAMRLAFLEGADLSELETVLEAGRRVGIDAGELARGVAEPTIKDSLRALNEQALALGVFGVPTLAAGGELFWGDDRLEDAAQYLRDRALA